MLEIRNVHVYYDDNRSAAIKDINLKLNDGDIYAFIGPSGCGKSTLLKVIAGLIQNYQGEVILNNRKISPKVHTIGYIPQNFGLLPWKTVEDNITLAYRIKNKKKIDDTTRKRIHDVVTKLGISSFLNNYPSELSGGQNQRVAIARAMALHPEILLMDEPFSALDALTRESIQELFLTIWKETKVTTFFITHSIEEAIYLGTKIVVMSPSPGRILKIIDNPVFYVDNKRTSMEFLEISSEIRTIMEREWKNENN